MIDNLLVAAYLIPTLFGLILVAPFGKSIGDSLSGRFEIMSTEREELLLVCNSLRFLVLQFQHRRSGYHQRLVKVATFAHHPLYSTVMT